MKLPANAPASLRPDVRERIPTREPFGNDEREGHGRIDVGAAGEGKDEDGNGHRDEPGEREHPLGNPAESRPGDDRSGADADQ